MNSMLTVLLDVVIEDLQCCQHATAMFETTHPDDRALIHSYGRASVKLPLPRPRQMSP